MDEDTLQFLISYLELRDEASREFVASILQTDDSSYKNLRAKLEKRMKNLKLSKKFGF